MLLLSKNTPIEISRIVLNAYLGTVDRLSWHAKLGITILQADLHVCVTDPVISPLPLTGLRIAQQLLASPTSSNSTLLPLTSAQQELFWSARVYWQGLEQPSPKCVIWTYRLYWAEGNWDLTDSKKFYPCLNYLKHLDRFLSRKGNNFLSEWLVFVAPPPPPFNCKISSLLVVLEITLLPFKVPGPYPIF